MNQTETTKPKRSAPRLDRVVIDEANQRRIDAWLAALTAQHKGIQITKTKLINWLIGQHADTLSVPEVSQLTTQFYDEEKFIRSALDEIKSAKARGETITLAEIMNRGRPTRTPRKPRTPRSGGDKTTAADAKPDGREHAAMSTGAKAAPVVIGNGPGAVQADRAGEKSQGR